MYNQKQVETEKQRIAFTIPDFEKFGELLHDRLHALLFHIEEVESKFMLITNLFDRNPERVNEAIAQGLEDTEALTYAGTKRQRVILELEKKGYPSFLKHMTDEEEFIWRQERNKNWDSLSKCILTRDNGSETVMFFDKFRMGLLSLTDIKVESLGDYFIEMDSDFKKYEYPIINDYFDIPNTYYVGIPLMGMGLFQGIVWILFSKDEIDRFSESKTIRRLVKLFQIEYDQLVLSWDIFGVNMNRKSVVDRAIGEVNVKNPIQEECKTKRYYEISQYYQQERIKQNDAVPDKLYEQYIKTSTISILLDSFAHNISAHSLTSLSWWFRERGDYSIKENKKIIDELDSNTNPLIAHIKKYPNADLSNELYTLLKFLLEKGAFWSGITRQTNFAGKISNLYNVLWFDFANNPLYLGTIANTEDVRKIHLNLTIYESESPIIGERFKNAKKIKRNTEGILLDGTFAIVNLDDFGKFPERSKTSIFVEEGKLYEAFKTELVNIKAFFPGGVIGKHALFTLLENEIRNIKHYKDQILADIQKNGLILNISIHERPADSSKNTPPEQYSLLKIGVWLKHEVEITPDLLVRRIEGLEADIVTPETFQPRLGGNHQDKICASMLMTNTFDKVQVKNSPIGEIYYPWIKTAGYKMRDNKEAYVEFEVSHRRYAKAVQEETFESEFESEKGTGYLKKYFHLWKGAEIITMEHDSDLNQEAIENKSCSRFIALNQPNEELKNKLKSDGTIRIISGLNGTEHVALAYEQWLPIWLKNNSGSVDTVIDFIEGETEVGRITYEKGHIRFDSYQSIKNITPIAYQTYKAIKNRLEIATEHGSKLNTEPDKLNYRTHGELMTRFCKGVEKMSKVQQMDIEDAYELLESLATKVCIFDRRIFSRLYATDAITDVHNKKSDQKRTLQKDRLNLYRKNLLLDFRTESISEWKTIQDIGFLNFHFVVIHLSFIESMEKEKDILYREENIIEFINDQILQGMPPELVPDNFKLVITTGRGRMAWWDTIKADPVYARFTTFRPIESLLGTVEDALQLKDDINLKFHLTKLLFGS